MIEKALIIVIFMYSASIGVMAIQFTIADVYGYEIQNFNGVPITSSLVQVIQTDSLNQQAALIAAGNYTGNETGISGYDRVETGATSGFYVAWELVQLLSGTYIFNVLYLLGVPLLVVGGLASIYLLLFARMVIGYIRGV